MDIIFTNTFDICLEGREPLPADRFIPEWYKNMESYVNGEKKPQGNGIGSGTVKRCIPVFDAITSGYILVTFTDIYVSQKDGLPWYEWAIGGDAIQFHPIEQAPQHPNQNGAPYPKFINPWGVQTPKGYSILFTQPKHRETPFTILDGIVDTDIYTAPVNFPFVLNDVNFKGIIPAGTPMAQLIPIKRDKWKIKTGNENNKTHIKKITDLTRYNFFDNYKQKFWNKKEYK